MITDTENDYETAVVIKASAGWELIDVEIQVYLRLKGQGDKVLETYDASEDFLKVLETAVQYARETAEQLKIKFIIDESVYELTREISDF